MSISHEKILNLRQKAVEIRIDIIKMLGRAGTGHTAGSLGMADIFTVLYFHSMKHNPSDPDWEDRDRLVLSNGHIAPVLYATMARAGYFDISVLDTLRQLGSPLQGHPHREFLEGVETSSGPLGSGLSQAVGMAIVDRMNQDKISEKTFFCLMGDGETNEGQVWEAAMLAGKEKLNNLICIIDRNHIQIDGYTDDVMPLEPYVDKWKSFNFHVIEIDGHDMNEIVESIEQSKSVSDKPTVIIARTIPSKGVPQWENDPVWHGKAPKGDEIEMALTELNRQQENKSHLEQNIN